jgi:hypothetical protein
MSNLSESIERFMPLRDRVALQWMRILPIEVVFQMTTETVKHARKLGGRRHLIETGEVALIVPSDLIETTGRLGYSSNARDADDEAALFQGEEGQRMTADTFFAEMARYIRLENAATRKDESDGRSTTPSFSEEGVSAMARFKVVVENVQMLEAEVHSGALEQTLRYRFFYGTDAEGRGVCVFDEVGESGWVRDTITFTEDTPEEALTNAQNAILERLGERPSYSDRRE